MEVRNNAEALKTLLGVPVTAGYSCAAWERGARVRAERARGRSSDRELCRGRGLAECC